MVLAANTTSLALATSRSMIQGENEEITPPYSTAVAEMLQRARNPPSNHTYRDGFKRSNTMKDLYFDPVSNEAEWKMQAR